MIDNRIFGDICLDNDFRFSVWSVSSPQELFDVLIDLFFRVIHRDLEFLLEENHADKPYFFEVKSCCNHLGTDDDIGTMEMGYRFRFLFFLFHLIKIKAKDLSLGK